MKQLICHNALAQEMSHSNQHAAQKMKFPLRISSVYVTKSVLANLVTFTKEVRNGKLQFLYSAKSVSREENYFLLKFSVEQYFTRLNYW